MTPGACRTCSGSAQTSQHRRRVSELDVQTERASRGGGASLQVRAAAAAPPKYCTSMMLKPASRLPCVSQGLTTQSPSAGWTGSGLTGSSTTTLMAPRWRSSCSRSCAWPWSRRPSLINQFSEHSSFRGAATHLAAAAKSDGNRCYY